MIIKIGVNQADPYYWIAARFGLVAIICLPFMIYYGRKLFAKRVRWPLVGAALTMTGAILCHTLAIYYSQASYVSIITLLTPVMLILLSSWLIGEKVTRRAVAGITLAAFGAMMIVILPIALAQQQMTFYPLATVLGLLNSVLFSLSLLLMRQVNEQKVPLVAVVGVTATLSMVVAGGLFWQFGDVSRMPTGGSFIAALIYSGLGIALLSRMVSIKLYEHTSASFMGAITYFETFLAVLLPVMILHEKLSLPMVIGGVLILLGIYVIEHHKRPHAKHHASWRHH